MENNRYLVLLNQKSRYIDRLYTYTSPLEILPGTWVKVPFGQGNKSYQGIVVKKETTGIQGEDSQSLKEIQSVESAQPVISKERLELAEFIKDEYLSSHMDAISLFYPQALREYKDRYQEYIEVKNRASITEALFAVKKNAVIKKTLYQQLLEIEGEIPLDTIKATMEIHHKGSGSAAIKYLKELQEEGIIEIRRESSYSHIQTEFDHGAKEITLSLEQQQAFYQIQQEQENANRPVLLRGITGSGKTELYIKLVQDTLSKKQGAIVLVPEISLTPQTISRFQNILGSHVTVIHSNLTQRERYDQLQRIRTMEAPLVIGARSALFAPVNNLGLIIIDECHDDAYRSEQSPRYDGVEVAIEMNRRMKTSLVMGSATPTVAQYHSAMTGEHYLAELHERPNGQPLPQVEIVNMTEDAKEGNISYLSISLRDQMEQVLARGNQVMLFINRRGYANHLRCESCGHVPMCENCDISLTYHRQKNQLICHYCGYHQPYDRLCPACGEKSLQEMGMGTEKIAEEVREYFPEAIIYRMDRDMIRKKGDHDRILSGFRQSSGSVLIGTQMIGKGHDFPGVSLVGILNADQGMYFPDYRASERTYAAIEQVGGRAGRGQEIGKVVIQTFSPEHPILSYVQNHDYKGFYGEEIKIREQFGYEPYGHLLRVLVNGPVEKDVADSIAKIKDALSFYLDKRNLSMERIFGPSPCSIGKIENRYRWQLLIKDGKDLSTLKKILGYILTEKRKLVLQKNVYATVEINPQSTL